MKKIIILFITIGIIVFYINKEVLLNNKNNEIENTIDIQEENIIGEVDSKEVKIPKNKVTDWKLTLVNYDNYLPDDFSIETAPIDDIRSFDKRAINELNDMIFKMREDKIQNIWIQSAYRTIELQKDLFDSKIDKYIKQGKTKEEAENLTLQTINRPRTSEHNLGLAVDFNYVDYAFEKTKAFEWLNQNAENYGFILRYKKEKESITRVSYEPWHWRYVGIKNAKEMNKLNMCLEEYISYLEN